MSRTERSCRPAECRQPFNVRPLLAPGHLSFARREGAEARCDKRCPKINTLRSAAKLRPNAENAW
eukprot:scaffold44370_cov82-Phaeocystis_antarctica.AAC.2